VICPVCQYEIEDAGVRACPNCAFAFDGEDDAPSVTRPRLEGYQTDETTEPGRDGFFIGEVTEEGDDDDPADAMIVGFLDSDREPSMIQSAKATANGRVKSVLIYATGSSSSILQPWAVPAVIAREESATMSPYEAKAFSLIDGQRSAREIHRLSGLRKHHVEGALLTLLDRGIIRLRSVRPDVKSPSSNEPVYPSEMTEDDLGETNERGAREPEDKRDDTLRIHLPERGPKIGGKAEAPAKPKESPLPEMNARARKLVLQAEKDAEAHDWAAAQRNLKLALTFDPGNAALKKLAGERTNKMPKVEPKAASVSPVRATIDSATECESAGDVDGAIEILERALKTQKDAAIYNRLGVILATRKKDFTRGRELVERALELMPSNETYRHNLGKILSYAATRDLSARKDTKSAGGLFGIFGKKK
jgi:hypothetical protein